MTKMLAKKMPNGTLKCTACARYCIITPGTAGYCGVRTNDNGKLNLMVRNHPAAMWIDPIEKKPFFHFLPGTKSFSFGTYGCNFSCSFCFAPDVAIFNDDSVKTLEEVFNESEGKRRISNGEVGFISGKKTHTATGNKKSMVKAFKHHFVGDLLSIKTSHAPAFSCTPDHQILMYSDGAMKKVMAKDLKYGDYLLIPKLVPSEKSTVLDVRLVLEGLKFQIKKNRKLDEKQLKLLMKLKAEGKTSRHLGKIFDMHPVYLRKLTCNMQKTGIVAETFSYLNNLKVDHSGKIKFKMEKGTGIPQHLTVNADLAELLGYYCAEGNTHKSKNRPSSYHVVFSYGKHEPHLVARTAELLEKLFGLKSTTLERRTTITLEVQSSILGALLTTLCGKTSHEKKVPSIIARSNINTIHKFLRAYVAGDGCILKTMISTNTVSKKLAFGIYHLFLLLGYLPTFHEFHPPQFKKIEGRIVKQSTLYYVKLGSENFKEMFLGNADYVPTKKCLDNLRFKETKTHWLVPIQKIDSSPYDGPVYNCEVDEEHTYLANFIAVSNCQNWDISQAPMEARIKDPQKWKDHFQKLVDKTEEWTPERIVESALAAGCKSISFTYNEPTIFTEYAIDVMKVAHKHGLKGTYVTNGYESREAWDALKNHIDAANIDLKAYNQKFYTQLCRAPNYEIVKDSILYARKLGIWVEVTTLLIPKWNDDPKEIAAEAAWLASVDPLMPWHVTAFHPDYKMMDTAPTPPETLMRSRMLGLEAGLKHVYCGNLGLAYSDYEATKCPKCDKKLVIRYGHSIEENNVIDGKCRFCKEKITGIWS